MQHGYVLYDPETLKVLCLTKGKRGIELIPLKNTEKLERALCLRDLTSIKGIYERFKENDLTKDLVIINIAKLYKHCN